MGGASLKSAHGPIHETDDTTRYHRALSHLLLGDTPQRSGTERPFPRARRQELS